MQRQQGLEALAQAQQALAQGPQQAVGQQAHAALPAPQRGLAQGVEALAARQAGVVVGVGAELLGQRAAQGRHLGAGAGTEQQQRGHRRLPPLMKAGIVLGRIRRNRSNWLPRAGQGRA
ncbi:MAG: hypothetical protein U1E77_08455 [Inhella sp.]